MEQNKSLFKISNEFRSIIDSGLDLENTDQAYQEEIMNPLLDELKNKADSVAAYARKLEADIETAKSELDRIKRIFDQRKRRAEKYNKYVLMCMDIMQESFVEGETSKISVRKPSKVVTIVDEKKIPLKYLIEQTTVKVDKLSIKEMLKNGHEIEGAKLQDGKRSVTFK